MARVCIDGLEVDVSRKQVEDELGRYGSIVGVFVAENPPGFAFVQFRSGRDAEVGDEKVEMFKLACCACSQWCDA
jgi:hypothetical protein